MCATSASGTMRASGGIGPPLREGGDMSLALAQAAVVKRGDGKRVWAFDMQVEGKTHGVIEFDSPPGCHIAPHVHRDDDELHYLIEGSATYTFGDKTYKATTGSLIFLPKKVPHALTFGDKGGRWLWITRESMEALLDEPIVVPVAELNAQARALEVPEDLVVETFARYGMDFIAEDGEL
jgi:quercetin dioxygenase-like cupin family protein